MNPLVWIAVVKGKRRATGTLNEDQKPISILELADKDIEDMPYKEVFF